MAGFDPISLALMLAMLALVPTLVVMTTSFLKVAIVLSLLRNAIGVQQIPPNFALYAIALIITVYVMAPVGSHIQTEIARDPVATKSVDGIVAAVRRGSDPLRVFLFKHSRPEHRSFFVRTAQRLWGPELAAPTPEDFIVVVPSFMVSELTEAFRLGFLLYLPFLVIDLVISNILLALGMMMVSPVTVSLPLKLFLFVMIDGWTRLIEGLILTYA